MRDIVQLKQIIEEALSSSLKKKTPIHLYQPIEYILSLDSKRIRPALFLSVAEMYNIPFEQVIEPAIGIEIFHNFTLVHDDIMDKANLRRGRETVHAKYGLNAGILSGDAMQIVAYQKICSVHPHILPEVMHLFNQTALEVCEGQQMDMDFETEFTVSEMEYLQMIELKTAVLLACSLKMSGMICMASVEDLNHLYQFGINIGIAFQIQDDLLDSFGSEAAVGKRIGGDICNNKKTLLLIKAMNTQHKYEKEILHNWMQTTEFNQEKVDDVKKIFISSFAKEYTENKMLFYYEQALKSLELLSVSHDKKAVLKNFADLIVNRKN
ncbi:MAG: polyprenyl synthetase family protein [Bacteroidetes bacterium]|nr:polyprenyl synthetase family protein [Bacteroidota bacterium]